MGKSEQDLPSKSASACTATLVETAKIEAGQEYIVAVFAGSRQQTPQHAWSVMHRALILAYLRSHWADGMNDCIVCIHRPA